MVKDEYIKQEFSKKYFTIEEVENLIPKIESILRKAVRLNKALDLLSSIEIEVYDSDYGNLRRVTKLNKQFHKLSYEFYSTIEDLENLGCVIKDLELGIVDFFSRFEERDIFLCWKLGEKKIRFWHEVDTGFASRKPILDLSEKR